MRKITNSTTPTRKTLGSILQTKTLDGFLELGYLSAAAYHHSRWKSLVSSWNGRDRSRSLEGYLSVYIEAIRNQSEIVFFVRMDWTVLSKASNCCMAEFKQIYGP